MAVTDVNLTTTNTIDLPNTSFVVCSVVTSPFSGLARCDTTDVYGRYVFVKTRSETKLQLCDVELFTFREYSDTATAATTTRYVDVTAVLANYVTATIAIACQLQIHQLVLLTFVHMFFCLCHHPRHLVSGNKVAFLAHETYILEMFHTPQYASFEVMCILIKSK